MKEVLASSASFSLQRTILANERTLLAYVRTAFSSLLLAIVLLKFLDNGTNFYGFLFLILSLVFIVIGVVYYFIRKKSLLATFYFLTKKK